MINLTHDTIDEKDRKALAEWIVSDPQLSQGELTKEFEKKFSDYLGHRYSVFVNSGSSANLAMIYALHLSGRLKNKKVVVPALCWSTSLSPFMQLGFDSIICDVDLNNLGVDTEALEQIFKIYNPAVFLSVNVLGFCPDYEKIVGLCEKYNVVLLEDNCESLGSEYFGKKLGTFGLMSSNSFYYSHMICTVEGGAISTKDRQLKDILLMIRNHGWDRSLKKIDQARLRYLNNVEDFQAMYTFYYPGFNLRNTQIGAFLGLRQLKKIDGFVRKRNNNMFTYHENLCNDFWKIKTPFMSQFISNFAYPVIHPRKNKIIQKLKEHNVECRPLICGNIAQQPFVANNVKIFNCGNADMIHRDGFYLPNHPGLTNEQIVFI
jgi:CDP-6-deoxy-D-xylo-4-hexulose-3-dehydrase